MKKIKNTWNLPKTVEFEKTITNENNINFHKLKIQIKNDKKLKNKYKKIIQLCCETKNQLKFLSIDTKPFFINKICEIKTIIKMEKEKIVNNQKSEKNKYMKTEFLNKIESEMNFEEFENEFQKIEQEKTKKQKEKKLITDGLTIASTLTSCIPILGPVVSNISSTYNFINATKSFSKEINAVNALEKGIKHHCEHMINSYPFGPRV